MATQSSEQPLPVRGYDLLATSGGYLQSTVLLLMRLGWGWKLYLSGYRHLHHVQDMIDNFREWHVPMPKVSVYVSGWTELLGGVLLMLGFATRIVSIPMVFNFCVAYATASRDTLKQMIFGGDLLSPPNRPGTSAGHLNAIEAFIDDAAFPFLILSLVLLAFGPGKASIDYLLQRKVLRRRRDRLDEPSSFRPKVDPSLGGVPGNIGPGRTGSE